ncbi:MAG: PKD domain-containing protein [Euryarchaeota archaeon]|nr:PKD domain-containing protein [Euryarchaeota archaeon]
MRTFTGRGTAEPLDTLSTPSASAELAWTNLSATAVGSAPPPLDSASMAYDPADGYLVLFGGTLANGYPNNDTWTYAGGTWTNITSRSPTHPSARAGAGFAWDLVGQQLVLFGGSEFTGVTENDTWTFRAGQWTNRSSVLSVNPPATYAPGMVTDSSDRTVLLFGGAWAKGPNGGTWSWNGTGWTNLTGRLATAPSPRLWSSLADDPWDNGVMLFGGFNDNRTYLSDTWVFRAGAWTNLTNTAPASPPPTLEGVLLAEAVNQSLVLTQGLFVPSNGVPVLSPFTWVWKGGSWTNLTALVSNAPPSRSFASSAELPGGGGMGVLFGGLGGGADLGDLEWLHLPLRTIASASPSLLPVGGALTYNATAEGGAFPITYSWTFGDGGSSGTASGQHTYASAGSYRVQFVATDTIGSRTYANFSVRVVTGLAVTMSATPPSCDAGMSIALTSTVLGGSSPYSYSWTFGDGSAGSSISDPSHLYASAALYPVRLNVSDPTGDQGTAEINISVEPLPAARLLAAPAAPRVGQAVNFTAALSGGTPPFTNSWTFGDGGTSSSGAPTHAFSAPGTYLVKLYAVDAFGRGVNATLELIVTSTGTPLSVQATDFPTKGDPDTVFTFNATTHGGTPPYSILWSFGDGTTAAGAQVTHTFLLSRGSPYNVSVNASDLVGSRALAWLLVPVLPLNSSGNPSAHSPAATTSLLLPILLAVAAAAVAVVLLGFYLRRRRGQRPDGVKGDPPASGAGPSSSPPPSEAEVGGRGPAA